MCVLPSPLTPQAGPGSLLLWAWPQTCIFMAGTRLNSAGTDTHPNFRAKPRSSDLRVILSSFFPLRFSLFFLFPSYYKPPSLRLAHWRLLFPPSSPVRWTSPHLLGRLLPGLALQLRGLVLQL